MNRFCIFALMAATFFAAESFGQYRSLPAYRPPVQNQGYQQNSYSTQSHWTQQIATENRAHDFGVVPSYSKQEHTFEFTNSFDYPIQLVGIRASCGCTKPFVLTAHVAPGETGQVLAKYDTKNFKGDKKATISVTVRRDKPFTEFGEIQFKVTGTIRRDVVLNPGTVAFENITLGKDTKRSVQILYAGNPNWKIAEIQSTNPNITVSQKELQRNANTRRVDYELTLELNGDQPVGTFKDQILVTTTDKNNEKLAINIQGNVRSVVQVSPVKLGVLTKDEKIEKRLIVRGARPFEIKQVKTSDNRIQFTPSEGSKTLHILTYKLDTSSTGQIVSDITIETDDPDQAATTVAFEAQIVPATFVLDNAPNNQD